MDKFVLIDGNSLINRAFYATPPLSAPDGRPTNAVYAFMNMLIKIINDLSPKYLLVAFDRKEPTFRHKIYDKYKGTRKSMPDDLVPQIPLLKEVLDGLGIAHFEKAGIEADDIIGTLAKRYDFETIIYTGDRDSFQLVDKTTSVYFTKRGISETQQLTFANFIETVGIPPINIIDLKALMGDSSDNIPGVAGVGEKTATTLIQKYSTIENLYDNIEEICGKLKEKLILDKDSAYLSKTLATINTSVSIDIDSDELTYKFPFSHHAKELFTKLGFVNLLKKSGLFEESNQNDVQINDTFIKAERTIIKYPDEILKHIKNDKISLVIGDYVNFCNGDNFEICLSIKESFFDEGFDYFEAIDCLKPIFSDSNKTIVCYNKKNLLHVLNKRGIVPTCSFEDVALIKYLIDYTGKDEELENVLLLHSLNEKTPAHSLFALYNSYIEKLNGDEKKLYDEIEKPLSDVLYDMELTGFKVDLENLNKMSNDYRKRLDEVSQEIFNLSGETFNINSPKQLGELLFEKLGLSKGKKTKSGYSTSSEVLEELIDKHPIVPLILQYRKIFKIASTYIEGFKPLIDKKTGLVHTTFNQVQTSTGRLSSREPNLQNIPVRDDEGREIRKLFSARSIDRVLVDADYSQIELRLLAAFSNCKPLIDAFNNGIDIHTATAAMVFGVKLEDVDSNMRRSAKAVNFGIIYGISDFGLAKNLRVPMKTAAEYIKKYFELYPEVKDYMKGNVDFAKKHGYSITYLGRKRYIREINSSNYNLRTFGERAAMNMPLQGAASDIIKIAMINVYNRLKKEGLKSKLILQVHDELIVDAYIDERDQVVKIVREEMENAIKLSVPLTVSLSVASNWFDAK